MAIARSLLYEPGVLLADEPTGNLDSATSQQMWTLLKNLAREHGTDVTTVTNRLHAVRKRFRAVVLAKLQELCADENEFREEARDLLGADGA